MIFSLGRARWEGARVAYSFPFRGVGGCTLLPSV